MQHTPLCRLLMRVFFRQQLRGAGQELSMHDFERSGRLVLVDEVSKRKAPKQLCGRQQFRDSQTVTLPWVLLGGLHRSRVGEVCRVSERGEQGPSLQNSWARDFASSIVHNSLIISFQIQKRAVLLRKKSIQG